MKNVLITGGAGFIGSNFIRYLNTMDDDVRVVNLDALTYAGNLENLTDLPSPERYKFVQGDVCDQSLVDSILRDHSIDTIVHFAAESHVDRSIHQPATFINTNILGTYTLLESARQYSSGKQKDPPADFRFHHVSTDEVYGTLSEEEPAWTENRAYAPNSPYSASKASSDHLVRAYGHTYGLPFTISNCSNNYGPNQFPEKLIPLTILNALDGKPIPVYGDGQQIRDWLFVRDHCEAIYAVLKSGKMSETYNVGGGNQPTNLEIVQTICDLLDERLSDSESNPHQQLIAFVKDRPGHDRRYAMDFHKIESELGWHPEHTLQDGLRETVDWYLHNLKWVEDIKSQSSYNLWFEDQYNLEAS